MAQPEAAGNSISPGMVAAVFNASTMAAGGLYQATGSLPVTVIGTATAAVLVAWIIWLRTVHAKRTE